MLFGKKMAPLPAQPKPPGLIVTVRAFGATLLQVLHTRFDLAALELEEQGRAVIRLASFAILALFCLSSAFFFLMVLLIVLFWAEKEIVVGVIFGVYLLLAIIFGALARNLLTAWPAFLGQTRHELKRDVETLKTQLKPEREVQP